MKRILTATIFLVAALAGRPAAAEATQPLIWCGLDYSKVKMIGTMDFHQPDQIFPGMLDAWNGLFMKEMLPKVESLDSAVETDVDSVEARNEKASASQIVREDGSRAEEVEHSHITDTEIADMVRSYNLKRSHGLGLVFIMDRLVKAQEAGCLYVVFFDVSSRKVLYSERVVAKAAGMGFRNYWFRPVKEAVGKLPKMYKQVK